MRTFAILTVLLLLLTPGAFAAGPAIRCIGPAPAAFAEAAGKAGFEVIQGGDKPDADILCLGTPFGADIKSHQKIATDVAAALAAGKSLILFTGETGESSAQLQPLEPLLPVNCWEFRFRRGDCGAAIAEGSPLNGAFDAAGFRVSGHYDLHLPYAPIEAGNHRYRWGSLGKDLLNTDWQVHLYNTNPDRLPLLVSGRVGPGKVFVFGADLYDPQLTSWNGYAAFIGALLNAAKPEARIASAPPAGNLELRIPLQQEGGLRVEIVNHGTLQAETLLAYKVSNGIHALLNSATKVVSVPANGTQTVALDERSPLLGDPDIHASADEAAHLRYIDAGLAKLDRTGLAGRQSRLVDTAPAVTVEILGENIGDATDLTIGAEDQLYDPTDGPSPRYIYNTGASPEVTVRVRNAFHNIAPLARARDENWPANPSAQGLNDLALNHGLLHGEVPLFGVWAGRSAATQKVALDWPEPVLLAGHSILAQSGFHEWDKGNPPAYTLASGDGRQLAKVGKVDYVSSLHRLDFAPATVQEAVLEITGLDPAVSAGPKPFLGWNQFRAVPTNCAITEWEALGWPSTEKPPPVHGELVVRLTNLITGAAEQLLEKTVSLDPLSEATFKVKVPAQNDFGPVRLDATFTPAAQGAAPVDAAADWFDLLFIPAASPALLSKQVLADQELGLLCTPGFIAFDEFGKGTEANTQGWGGPDDTIWAWTHDFMETGDIRHDLANCMFTSSVAPSIYICPWRDFPSGEYFWDWAGDRIEEWLATGPWKGAKNVRLFLSDRWNGIHVNSTFTWADFIRFDEYLRATAGKGLEGRSRRQISDEITTKYGDKYQVWQMNRYADQLLKLQARAAKYGARLTVTTHGGFPLAGGELGAKIARTHKATGIDVFWDLDQEDLYGTLGSRFGLVAANPDLEPGFYNQWGWVNSILSNPSWWAVPGNVEPSRRMWYSLGFMGRVDLDGKFQPFSIYGFDTQGSYGPVKTADDSRQDTRTVHLVTRVRPEAAAGVGLVVSWPAQERRMGPKAGQLGFGLFPSTGAPVPDLVQPIYDKLVRNGVPISFVTSTDGLKKWNGKNPLIVLDGADLEAWEASDLERLNRAGAPVIALGDAGGPAIEKVASLYGMTSAGGALMPGPTATPLKSGTTTLGTLNTAPGAAGTFFAPIQPAALTNADAEVLAREILRMAGDPIETSPGIVVDPFVNNGHLWLALNDLGDRNRVIDVSVRPSQLLAAYTGAKFRVIDVDRAREIPSKWENDRLVFSLPAAATDGRLLLVIQE